VPYMWSGTGAQATLQDIAPDAWASTKDSYISGVASAANVDAKWVKVTGVSASAPLVVSTQARPPVGHLVGAWPGSSAVGPRKEP